MKHHRSLLVAALCLLQLHATLAIASYRVMHITNYCSQTMWFHLTAGSAPTVNGGACNSDSDCVAGANCNVNNHICFWNIPTPSTGNFRLSSQQTTTVSYPILSNGQTITWSGNIGGCLNGTCGDTQTNCDQKGCTTPGGSPETKAEFTLAKNGIDYYDVEVINGHNIAVEMSPRNVPVEPSDPYACGNPGGAVSKTGAGNCSWVFNPPSVEYYWVSTGGVSCSSNSDCSAYPGTICGLSNNIGQNPRFRKTCGKHYGYWTADQICGVDQSYGAPFYCSQSLNAPNAGKTYWNLYACNNGVPSCYQNGAGTDCCGCANWNQSGIYIPPITTQCKNSNPNWMSIVFPTLQFLKTACPTAYTYPYDDMSSTFVCTNAGPGGANSVEYDINFCPELALSSPTTTSSAGRVETSLALLLIVTFASLLSL